MTAMKTVKLNNTISATHETLETLIKLPFSTIFHSLFPFLSSKISENDIIIK